MERKPLHVRILTFAFFLTGIVLFVAYESGYFRKRETGHSIANQNAAIKQNGEAQVSPGVIEATDFIVMSSSKSTVINHSVAGWIFPIAKSGIPLKDISFFKNTLASNTAVAR